MILTLTCLAANLCYWLPPPTVAQPAECYMVLKTKKNRGPRKGTEVCNTITYNKGEEDAHAGN